MLHFDYYVMIEIKDPLKKLFLLGVHFFHYLVRHACSIKRSSTTRGVAPSSFFQLSTLALDPVFNHHQVFEKLKELEGKTSYG
jgi:hypothetical protein